MSRVYRHGRDAGLHPVLLDFLGLCERRLDFDCLLVWGGRTAKQQAEIYERGRTTPGPNVTAARPLGDTVTNARDISETAHGRFAAVDLVPLCHGRPNWEDKDGFYEIGQLAESCGLTWGGRFTRKKRLSNGVTVELPFFDGAHVEITRWRELPIPKDDNDNGPNSVA